MADAPLSKSIDVTNSSLHQDSELDARFYPLTVPHLKDFRGVIHADGYAGFNELFIGGRIVEAGLW